MTSSIVQNFLRKIHRLDRLDLQRAKFAQVVGELFQHHVDLLEEFRQFLPKAMEVYNPGNT